MKKVIDTTPEKLVSLRKYQVIKDYLAFIALPAPEQQRRWEAWDRYYEECRQTPSALMYYEAQKALKGGDLERVQDLSTQARRMIKNGDVSTVSSPPFPDPNVIFHDQQVYLYKNLIEQLRQDRANQGTDF